MLENLQCLVVTGDHHDAVVRLAKHRTFGTQTVEEWIGVVHDRAIREKIDRIELAHSALQKGPCTRTERIQILCQPASVSSTRGKLASPLGLLLGQAAAMLPVRQGDRHDAAAKWTLHSREAARPCRWVDRRATDGTQPIVRRERCPNGSRWNGSYVAQVSGSQISAIDVETGAIEAISPMGGDIVGPDDLAFDSEGNLYATEITEGRVSVRAPNGTTRVLQGDMPVANPITFHEGRLIAGECRVGGRIMELDLNGGAPRMILDNVPMPNAFSVGPDGKLYTPVMGTNEIWRVSLEGGAPKRWPATWACRIPSNSIGRDSSSRPRWRAARSCASIPAPGIARCSPIFPPAWTTAPSSASACLFRISTAASSRYSMAAKRKTSYPEASIFH